jgi:hypothetical protein
VVIENIKDRACWEPDMQGKTIVSKPIISKFTVTNTLEMVNDTVQNIIENSSKGTEDTPAIVDSVSQSVSDMEDIYTFIKNKLSFQIL